MISISAIRRAHRIETEARIAAFPSAARFTRAGGASPLLLSVRTSEPRKSREMKQGGFDPMIELEAEIALPLTAARPEPQKDFIQIVDLSGEYRSYSLASVTPLRGLNCYLLGLRNRKTAPSATQPPRLG